MARVDAMRRSRPRISSRVAAALGFSTSALRAVRSFYARRDEPYAGADLDTARRLGGVVWLLSAAILVLLLPFHPPTEAIGDAGWAVAAAVLVLGVVGQRAAQRSRRTHYELLLKSYTAVAAIAVVQWLAGGFGPPYYELFLFWAVYTAAVHPARPATVFLVVLGVAASLPLLYEGWDTARAGEIGLHLLLYFALGLLAVVLVSNVRAQRISLREREEAARRQARVDALTGLGNRRALEEMLDAEVARAERTGHPLSLVTADVDDFKHFNDAHGHREGDRILREVAAALRRAVRRPDACFRWGGDEFAIVLPETRAAGAIRVCRRLEAAVPVPIKWGVAEAGPEMDADELLSASDQALIAAKDTVR